jgi:diadenosine tetraphosphate (Ap4A) HIT family hydrolase
MSTHVNNSNVRSQVQLQVHEQIIKDGVCPFCLANFKKYHKAPIIAETEYWLATDNQWPYDYVQNHILIISKKHLTNLSEVSERAFGDLGKIVKKVLKQRRIDYGGLGIRFGDTNRTGATVEHLHCHIIQAADDLPPGQKVKMKFSR